MKLFTIKISLFLLNLITILATKLKNATISLNKNNVNDKIHPLPLHRHDFPHLTDQNLRLFENYLDLIKNNSHRIGEEEYNSEFSGKQFIYGTCLVKYKGYIINLYPLSEREGSGFFLKYKRDVLDFDICKNIYTHTGRFGLFVDRNKDVVYAGDANSEKYFNVGLDETQENDEEEHRVENIDNRIDHISNLKRKEDNSIVGRALFRPKNSKTNKGLLKIKNVTVFLSPGEKCKSNADFEYIIAYRFICDLNSIKPIMLNANRFDPESCFNVIEIKTDLVCAQNMINFRLWFQVLDLNKEIIAVIIMFVGFFLILFSDLFRLKSFLSTICLSTLYTIKFFVPDMNYVLFLGILVGMIFLMVFLRDNQEILMYISSLLLSLQIGSFVFNITARNILENYSITIDQYFIMIYVLSFFAIFSISDFFSENLFFALIFNTSFGSFLFIRGISIIFKGYPDERYCYILLEHREYEQYDRNFSKTKIIYAIAFLALWFFSILLQHYIIVPVMHKLNQLEKDRKANLKMLNKLGEGFIHVDEGSEPEENLLDDEKKEEKKKEDQKVTKKASLFGALLKKKFMEESENQKDSSKNNLLREGFNHEKEIIEKENVEEQDHIIIAESNPILNLLQNKSKYDKKSERKEIRDNNDVYLNTSENIIVESSKNNIGFGDNKDIDNSYEKKRDNMSYKNPKVRFNE